VTHVDPPQYAWTCQYCGQLSPSGTASCASCGFPAHTSAFELERAKQLGSVQAFLDERQTQRDKWRRKSLPRKVLLVVALFLFFGGLVLLRFGWGRNMVLGAAMMGGSLLLGWLAN
jgi:hypothetical protein